MFSFTLKDLFLNFTDEPSRIYLHKPHLGSLHFFTLHSSVYFFLNLAFVDNRFKFGGCLLLFYRYPCWQLMWKLSQPVFYGLYIYIMYITYKYILFICFIVIC